MQALPRLKGVFLLVDVQYYFSERQQVLFRVADVLKFCNYKDDANNFYKQHKAKHCKSWTKGPKSCWYCEVDDVCDIAGRSFVLCLKPVSKEQNLE